MLHRNLNNDLGAKIRELDLYIAPSVRSKLSVSQSSIFYIKHNTTALLIVSIEFTTSEQLAAWTHLFTESLPSKVNSIGVKDYNGNVYQYHKAGYIQTTSTLAADFHHLDFVTATN